jgi:hypothetical protein
MSGDAALGRYARGTQKASKVHMMSTVPCPELESLRSDYELTLRAGAEIEFPLVGSSIKTLNLLRLLCSSPGLALEEPWPPSA